MIKKQLRKSFFARLMTLLVLALMSTANVWGDVVTYKMTPNNSTTGSTSTAYVTTVTEFTYSGITWAMNQWNPSTLQIKTNQGSASSEFYFKNTSPFPGRIKSVVIKFAALTVTDATKLCFVGGSSAISSLSGGSSGEWNATAKTLTWTPASSTNYAYFAFYQNGKAASGTNKLASSDAIVVTYEGSTTPEKTLTAVTVSGNPTKTEYYEGEAFDPTGLTVMGTYDDESEDKIAAGDISWTITPSSLAVGNTQAVVKATVKGIKSEEYVVNGLTVKAIANTQETAYTVAEARALIDANPTLLATTNVYVKGIISEIVTAWSDEFENITYNISDDGETTSAQFQLFRCVTNGATVGDSVIATGTLTKYDKTYEFKAGNEIVSLVSPTKYTVTFDANGGKGEMDPIVTVGEKQIKLPACKFTFEGKVFDGWKLVGSSVVYDVDASYNVTGDATFSAQWRDAVEYTVTWNVNGDNSLTTKVTEGNTLVLPAAPSDIANFKFQGWATAALTEATDDASEITFVHEGAAVTGNVEYFAVFANAEGSAGNYEKVTSAPDNWCGKYLIVYETDSLAFNGSLETLDAVSNTKKVAISNNIIATSTEMDNIAFTVAYKTGSSTIYSLKSASGKYISGTTISAKASNGLKQADTDEDYEISFNGITIESKSSDQQMQLKYNKASDQTRFRFYKSGQQPVALYKKQEATYSNYCTTVPPCTYSVTISDAGYATLGLPYAVEIPEGVTAYAGKRNESTVTLTEITGGVIPAECGVVLKAAQGNYTFTETNDVNLKLDNDLVAATSAIELAEGDAYLLTKKDAGSVVFRLCNAGTLAAGKAYLPAPVNAKFELPIGDETTGIEDVDNSQIASKSQLYNLNGMRVNENYKGVTIMDGKKYLAK